MEKYSLIVDIAGITTTIASNPFSYSSLLCKVKFIMKIRSIIQNLIILCVFPMNSVQAFEQIINCSHIELCKLAKLIILENELQGLKTNSLVNITGDPHEYEPSTLEIKSLISSKYLLNGPNELNPWIKKINFQRSKNSELSTLTVIFDKNDLNFYPRASTEELSHFWLYPKIYCSFKIKIENEFKKLGYNIIAKNNCATQAITLEANLTKVLSELDLPIILTHNALLPLLISLDPKKNIRSIIAIKGSGHHEEASTLAIKKMYDALKSKQVIWIEETGIHVPSNILNKIRSTDIKIRIDTATSSEQIAFSTLQNLADQLSLIAGKKQ